MSGQSNVSNPCCEILFHTVSPLSNQPHGPWSLFKYNNFIPDFQYKNVDIIHSAEEAKNIGVQRAKQELNNQIKDPESILNEQVDVSQGGGYVEVEVTYEVQENIGTKEKIVF